MNHQNIIMLCQQSWDIGLGFNAKNMAKELAKNNRVLFVNTTLDVKTAIKNFGQPDVKKRLRILFGRQEGLVQAEENLWVLTPGVIGLSINWLTSRSLFKILNRWNSTLLAGSIRKAAQALGFDSYHLFQDGIIYQGLELKQLLAPRTFTYYVRDYMLAVPYFQRHGPWVEAELMRQADAVVANSAYLNDYARQHNPHSYDIGQGCVLSMYQADIPYPPPPDLSALPRPYIGYTGFLTGIRLDIKLLRAIAEQRPQWSLVLVGPEDFDFQASDLHELPNVHFLGSKAPNQLAAYLQHFDVCMNPQANNEVTAGNYPLKIDEYLAMGKPVVATATRTMELFADHVHLADGPEQWLQAIEAALADDDPARSAARIAFAQSHTWAASVQKLSAAVEQTTKRLSSVPA
ncbi:glycosyltransferase [uncultured Hymenobacter sp.]|uniref:glycosyltransferase n=1 Tax=uncultured Hymenobacter sp. TaxID=170016 RepID=UPI0035C9941C